MALYNGYNERHMGRSDKIGYNRSKVVPEYICSSFVVPAYMAIFADCEDHFSWYFEMINTSIMPERVSYFESLKNCNIDILCKSGN